MPKVFGEWRKSSYSASGHCVEVSFHKSTFSNPNGNCVEVATPHQGAVLVRDSKNQDGPVLAFTPDEWTAFLAGVRAGEFNL